MPVAERQLTFETKQAAVCLLRRAAQPHLIQEALNGLSVGAIISLAQSETSGNINISLVYKRSLTPIKWHVFRKSPSEIYDPPRPGALPWTAPLEGKEIIALSLSESDGYLTLIVAYRD